MLGGVSVAATTSRVGARRRWMDAQNSPGIDAYLRERRCPGPLRVNATRPDHAFVLVVRAHHDTGQLLAKRHIPDDAAGYKILLELLAEYGDTAENPIPVAIETSRGLLVAVLRTGKRKVFAINPMAAARYRGRHSVSRKKSDVGDALVLANILRTDMHAHRPLPDDSDLGRAITVLPAPSRTPCGTGSSSPTSSGPCCASTTPPPWPPSPPGPTACAGPRPASSSRRRRPRPGPRG